MVHACATRRRRNVRERAKNDGDDVDNDVDDDDDGNIFVRLTGSRARECLARLRRSYPENYIISEKTDHLALGLKEWIGRDVDARDRLDDRVTVGICIALVTLFIFSKSSISVMLFLIKYTTAIRFPGQFLKSVLKGTSDSGKSRLVSDVIRPVFSSNLTGSIINYTMRQGTHDEINTDVMSMMNSHGCQCDEPERINAELLKTMISDARMKCRRFHDQQPRHLTNMAKLILTLNDGIDMRSDAGVISRLKYCINCTHRFKTLLPHDADPAIDFNAYYASSSVSYQFARLFCFPQVVNFEQFRAGLSFCTYSDETVFSPIDVATPRRTAIPEGLAGGRIATIS